MLELMLKLFHFTLEVYEALLTIIRPTTATRELVDRRQIFMIVQSRLRRKSIFAKVANVKRGGRVPSLYLLGRPSSHSTQLPKMYDSVVSLQVAIPPKLHLADPALVRPVPIVLNHVHVMGVFGKEFLFANRAAVIRTSQVALRVKRQSVLGIKFLLADPADHLISVLYPVFRQLWFIFEGVVAGFTAKSLGTVLLDHVLSSIGSRLERFDTVRAGIVEVVVVALVKQHLDLRAERL